MKGHFKFAVLTALLFASAGIFGIASNANADVIDEPGSAGSIKQVNSGNVLKDYDEEALTRSITIRLRGIPRRSIRNMTLIHRGIIIRTPTQQFLGVPNPIRLRPSGSYQTALTFPTSNMVTSRVSPWMMKVTCTLLNLTEPTPTKVPSLNLIWLSSNS